MTQTADEFSALMQRVREGDQDAAREVFERYADHVRRVVRRNLDLHLRRQYDSTDFAQSVWASFFHIPTDKYDFPTPEALVAFLARVAANKVVEAGRKKRARKCDVTREQSLEVHRLQDGESVPLAEVLHADVPTPSQVAIADEHWEQLLAGLPPHHRRVLELIREGYTHAEIAAATEIQPKTIQRLLQALRHRLVQP